ncbi:MAG: hypothetical protein VB050_03230 [Geobacteraceae bacterium]|nr:hypothetical protein [Geobacteraceae bacterium]
MAKVALFDEQQKRWVQYDEDTEVLLSYLSKPDALNLNKKVDKIVSRTGADRSTVWNQKLGEEVVHDWRHKERHSEPGLVYPDGTPIPYNPVNRDLMMKGCREFSIFVGETCIDAAVYLEIDQQIREAGEIKND